MNDMNSEPPLPKCTKPIEVPAPSYCGRMPSGVDCAICQWNRENVERRKKVLKVCQNDAWRMINEY